MLPVRVEKKTGSVELSNELTVFDEKLLKKRKEPQNISCPQCHSQFIGYECNREGCAFCFKCGKRWRAKNNNKWTN